VAWLYGVGLTAGIMALALQPGEFGPGLRDLGPIRNPLGVEAAASTLALVNAVARLIVTVLYLAAVGALLGGSGAPEASSASSSSGWPTRPPC
jgi:hypothetical protein